jgi:hypothetical protein
MGIVERLGRSVSLLFRRAIVVHVMFRSDLVGVNRDQFRRASHVWRLDSLQRALSDMLSQKCNDLIPQVDSFLHSNGMHIGPQECIFCTYSFLCFYSTTFSDLPMDIRVTLKRNRVLGKRSSHGSQQVSIEPNAWMHPFLRTKACAISVATLPSGAVPKGCHLFASAHTCIDLRMS